MTGSQINGAASSIENQIYHFGDTTALASAPAVNGSGFTFRGWTATAKDGTVWTVGEEYENIPANATGSVTLNVQMPGQTGSSENWSFGGTVVVKPYAYAGSGKAMLLVGGVTPESGYAFAYNGSAMYTTTDTNYQKLIGDSYSGTVYVYLVELSEGADLAAKLTATETAVVEKLGYIEGSNTAIVYNGDISGTSNINSHDWGLVSDMLAAPDVAFTPTDLTVLERLKADVAKGAHNDATKFGGIDDVNAIIEAYYTSHGITRP